MKANPPVISFFTGAGLLDIGFEQAGFDIAWTNEKCATTAKLYSQGVGSWRASQSSALAQNPQISAIEDIKLLDIASVCSTAFKKRVPRRFGVIGGPPCPDFSVGGLNGGANGTSGRLFDVFVESILAIAPSFFLIENVPGLARTKKHRAHLEECITKLRTQGSYLTDWAVISGLELGVPQNRERVFIVGFDRDWVMADLRVIYEDMESGWFRWPRRKHPNAMSFQWPVTSPFGSRPSRPPLVPIDLTVYPVLCRKNDPERVANGKEWFQPYSSKFNERNEGDVFNKSFKRLHRYRYSPTAWYGNNEVHLHPWKPRRLSVREALRIQTVPDSYVWAEEIPLSSKFRAIGNGVPCKMARSMALSIASFIKTKCRKR